MKILLALLLTFTCASATETEPKTFKASDGTEVPYQIAAPEKSEDGKRYPLVLFLHGSGQRGNDNKAQLKNGVHDMIENAGKLAQPIFLIAPQCPKDKTWAPYRINPNKPADGKNDKPFLDAVLELVDEIATKLPVDRKRIYITGLSLGGFGTWAAITEKPDVFAAAIPICGAGDPLKVSRIKDMPIRIFHGGADDVVPLARSQMMFDVLKKAGSEAELTIYPGVGHDSWTRTYADVEVIRWLFAQTKSD